MLTVESKCIDLKIDAGKLVKWFSPKDLYTPYQQFGLLLYDNMCSSLVLVNFLVIINRCIGICL